MGGAILVAITVEDGSIVADANSYVTEAELTAYATSRGVTLSAGTEQLLIQAMDYIESQLYIGVKSTQDQPLQWPRSGAYVDGYLVGSSTIPAELKNAQMASAISVDSGNDPLAVVEPGVKREKVDVIEVEYQDGAMSAAFDPKINAMLRKLLAGGGAGSNFTVTRV